MGIEAIEWADLLFEAQKRGIFYENATRFLRLDEKGQVQERPRKLVLEWEVGNGCPV